MFPCRLLAKLTHPTLWVVNSHRMRESFPVEQTLLFHPTWWNLHVRCRKCGTPVGCCVSLPGWVNMFCFNYRRGLPVWCRNYRTPVRCRKAFQLSNLTFFVLWSSHPLPFQTYVWRGLPVQCHEYWSPVGRHVHSSFFGGVLRCSELIISSKFDLDINPTILDLTVIDSETIKKI